MRSTSREVFLNLRNRLIWIAALTLAFAIVQTIASRRKAARELVDYLQEEFSPVTTECVRQAQVGSPRLRGTLTLQVAVVPTGKLAASVERVEVSASSDVQGPELAACISERAKTLVLKHPLLRGPEQVELTLPVEPPTLDKRL